MDTPVPDRAARRLVQLDKVAVSTIFLIAVLAYTVSSILLSYLTGLPHAFVQTIDSTYLNTSLYFIALGFPVSVFSIRILRGDPGTRGGMISVVICGILAIVSTVMLQFAFSAYKSAIPLASGFWADTALADLDAALFGGTDPWRLAHRLVPVLSPWAVRHLYFGLWPLLALAAPVAAAVFDRDAARLARFFLGWLFCWPVLGSLVATLGASAGPIFFERATGSPRFAPLQEALRDGGIAQAGFDALNAVMWTNYQAVDKQVSLSISAFPSVHVAVSTLLALYLSRIHWLLGAAGWVFALTILFISVYIGWHYAIDGLFSIAAVCLIWKLTPGLLRRFAEFRPVARGSA